MLKHTLLALAGLAAVVPAASADTFLPVLPRPVPVEDILPFYGHDRTVELCGRFGIACSVPGANETADVFDLIPLAQADAAKRLEQQAEVWAEIAELYENYTPYHVPVPNVEGTFGWMPGEGQIADITELLEDMQDRLAHRPMPLHGIVRPHHFNWPNALGNLPGRFSWSHSGPAIINHFGQPRRPGNSVIILPAR